MNNDNLSSNILNEEDNDNSPLSNEELSRLIQATRDNTFKIKEIKNQVSKEFKKVSLHDIAKKYNEEVDLKNEPEDKKEKKIESKTDINEDHNNKINTVEKSNKELNKKENINNLVSNKEDVRDKVVEEIVEEKKINETEHLKILENTKKENFEKGKEAAYLEIKEGSDAAIAKLNSISDKILKTDKLDLSELENIISNKILQLSSELTGKIIKAIPTEFLKKIKSFVASLDNNDGKIDIFISDEDFKVLEKNKDIKGKLKEMNITGKAELLNGEVELLINGIRIKQKLES